MKKLTLVLSFFVTTLSVFAQTEQDSVIYSHNPKHNIYVKPLDFFIGGFSIGYERIFDQGAFKTDLGYYFNEEPSFYDGTNLEGFRAEVAYKVFYKTFNEGEVHVRPYFAAYGLFKYASIEEPSFSQDAQNSFVTQFTTARASAMGIGVLIGAQAFVYNGFTVDLYIGGGIFAPVSGDDRDLDALDLDIVNPYNKAVAPRANLTLGYSF